MKASKSKALKKSWMLTSFMACCFMIFLSASQLTAQVVEYKIITTTGQNGTNKPVIIELYGTLGKTASPIHLDEKGRDDFKWNARDEFTIRSRDLGDITDIRVKAHPDDHWKADRIEIYKLGVDKDGKPHFKSEWTLFREPIPGKFQEQPVRADNIKNPVVRMDLSDQKVITDKFAVVVDNINNLDGKDECASGGRSFDVSETVSVAKGSSQTVTNAVSTGISANIKGIVDINVNYSLEISNEVNRSFENVQTKSGGATYTPNFCAVPGMIKYELVNKVETRRFAKVFTYAGEDNVSKLVSVAFESYRTVSRTYQQVEAYLKNPASDPELAEAIRLSNGEVPRPRNPSYPPISFGDSSAGQETAGNGQNNGSNTSIVNVVNVNNNNSNGNNGNGNAMVVKTVKFFNQAGLTLAQAQQIAQQNKWQLATPDEVVQAWTHLKLDVYAFGLMSNGQYAVPVQVDHSNFKTGHNVGAVGGNQGFLYTELGTPGVVIRDKPNNRPNNRPPGGNNQSKQVKNNVNPNTTYAACAGLTDQQLRRFLLQNTFQRVPAKNGNHTGKFTKCQADGTHFTWTDQGGRSWDLRPNFHKAMLIGADNNPYKGKPGGDAFVLIVENRRVTGFRFMNQTFEVIQ